MGNLDPTKIAIVLIVALVVLGPEKLPGFTKQLGAWWGEFQRVRARIQGEINGAVGQINNVASPLTETFKAASAGASGIIPSIFSPQIGKSESSEKQANSDRGISTPGTPRPSLKAGEGWGSGEGESGYRYGDPRLN